MTCIGHMAIDNDVASRSGGQLHITCCPAHVYTHHVELHCCLGVHVYPLRQKSQDIGFCFTVSVSVGFRRHELACRGIQYHTVTYNAYWVLRESLIAYCKQVDYRLTGCCLIVSVVCMPTCTNTTNVPLECQRRCF